MNPPEHAISVRELAEFVHRRGDLGAETTFRRSNRALEGIKGHKRIQQSRGPDYRPEVPVARSFVKGDLSLRVAGRVDGIVDGLTPLVEEIKTVEPGWRKAPDPVHWAQLRIYGGILALDRGWPHASLQLTYLELDTNEIFIFREETSREALVDFLNETVEGWFTWLIPHVEWVAKRNASIEKAPFPFITYRAGQRELARSVYRAVKNRLNLFVEAPTGMGKTVAILYPAVKALPVIADGKVFYVTAKTPGRIAAQDALNRLRDIDVQVRSVSLTAKAKICFAPDPAGCDPATCPFRKGYYDRYKPAMRELLATQRLDSDNISVVARKHQVCPFELSLDVSNWVDVVIGDYNYVFDPTVMLQRYFGEGSPKHVVLIDEAHNLVDRSREMYSASLTVADLSVSSVATKDKAVGRSRRALAAARDELEAVMKSKSSGLLQPKPHHRSALTVETIPEPFIESLRVAAGTMESFLVDQTSREEILPWLEPYFAIRSFLQVNEGLDETYRVIIDPEEQSVTLFCVDPSKQLAQTLKGLRSAIFFSATLSPLDYFVDVLGGSDASARGTYPSPFRSDQMMVRIAPLDLSFQARGRTMDSVVEAICRHLRENPGNNLIYCPSMAYLEQLHQKLSGAGVQLFAQRADMAENERESFLAKLTSGINSVGLAVMGGIFAEGIDLPGEQLVGVTVIGVGLPSLSLKRDLLAAYFEQKERPGFDYAYRYPGIQRVLQAVGRLIRSEEDQGAALLVDRRYLEERYEMLLPGWWRIVPTVREEYD